MLVDLPSSIEEIYVTINCTQGSLFTDFIQFERVSVRQAASPDGCAYEVRRPEFTTAQCLAANTRIEPVAGR